MPGRTAHHSPDVGKGSASGDRAAFRRASHRFLQNIQPLYRSDSLFCYFPNFDPLPVWLLP